MKIEWDAGRATADSTKHGVPFDEATTVFLDQFALSGIGPDPDHSVREDRYITFGMSSLGRLLVVSHTYRLGGIRLISARRVTRAERKLYEES